METRTETRIGEIVSTIDPLVTDLFAVLPMQSVSISDLVDIQRLLSRTDLFCTRTVAAYETDGSCVDDGFRDVAAVMSLPKPVNTNPDDGNPDDGIHEELTLTQRRHDALHDIAIEALTTNDHPLASGGQHAHISLIVNNDGSAHTMNSYFMSSFTRDMLMCDSIITAIKLNCHGNPFDVGTPQTDIPSRNRRAVVVRDRCCRYPGCDRPARWADIHHIKQREHGGTHEIDNLVLICRFHHRHIHKHAIQLQWAPDHITLTLLRFPNQNHN